MPEGLHFQEMWRAIPEPLAFPVTVAVAGSTGQEGLEELSHVEGQEGCGEEIPHVQGKEQWLRFAGAALKRYPTSKVTETQVRW